MLTPSQLLDILLLPAFYLALGAWVVVSLVLLLRGLAGGRRALALARARQRLQEIANRRLDPESEHSALVALVATLPESSPAAARGRSARRARRAPAGRNHRRAPGPRGA